MKIRTFLFPLTFVLASLTGGRAQVHVLDSGWHHLRNAGPREWATFPETPDNNKLVLHFASTQNATDFTLALRQEDVKQNWNVTLNGKSIGLLVADEKDLVHYLRIAQGVLKDANTLEISTLDEQPDDIRVGEITLYEQSPEQLLSGAHLSLEVIDRGAQQRTPSRITIVNDRGILQSVRAVSDMPVAVRPGYVYTGHGTVVIGLLPGRYTIYATRGFEYSVDSVSIDIGKGDHHVAKLYLTREVATPGWISCDPHVHTFTWSGHGDASAVERVLTLAGEGIEMPVITDHNVHADLSSFASDQRLDRYFTPVIGNEVTTSVGHFNVFPLNPDDPVIPHRQRNWAALAKSLPTDGSKAVVLNHPRDIHRGFRPFDPKVHLAPAGVRLDGQTIPANAMEVFNSGAQQTDPLQLVHDWFGLMNHGQSMTPVGSSDSHDVSRYIVGQARTYIRGNDESPGEIDTDVALRNFIEGNVMVNFGLLAEIEVDDTYGPGELVPASDAVKITVNVLGPSWVQAEKVTLFANGQPIHEEVLGPVEQGGVKWSGEWHLTMPTHDVFLVAVVEGPGRQLPYWPIAKPYQPSADTWTPRLLGISGAVWLDADRNGRPTSALEYAKAILENAGNDYAMLIQELADYHTSVAIQVAALLHLQDRDLTAAELTNALRSATESTRRGFQIVLQALPDHQDTLH